MSLTYTQYVAEVAALMASDVAEPNLVAILPGMIAYAEQRIYQELDLISTIVEGDTALTAGNRAIAIPSSIIIAHDAQVITPAGTAIAAGERNPLQRVSMSFLNFVWPSAGSQALPTFYSMQDATTIILAPTPDQNYHLAVQGPIRPTPLSGSNTTTYLTLNYEALFIAASMIFAAGFQKNFGAQADDPKMSQSWENQYQTLKASVSVEDARRKAQSVQWQALSPAPLAKDSRT